MSSNDGRPAAERGPHDERRASLEEHYEVITDADYRRRWSLENPGNRAAADERDAVLAKRLAAVPVADRYVLDLGCGTASVVPGLDAGHRVGVDLLIGRLTDPSHPLRGRLANADGCALPFPDDTFAVVLLLTTLSSVPDRAVRHRIAAEAARVLRPGGAIVWYDLRFPSPGNTSVQPIGRRELRSLFPGYRLDVASLTVIPPLARRLGRLAPALYPLFARLPFLRSHLGGVIVRPA